MRLNANPRKNNLNAASLIKGVLFQQIKKIKSHILGCTILALA